MSGWRRWLWRASLAAGIVLHVSLALTSMRGKSATFDECIHLPPGYMSLKLGDHRMNPDHPPLVRRIAALPLLFLDVHTDPHDPAWTLARPWEFGKRFLFRWNDADRLLSWGRLGMVGLSALLAIAVFGWARLRFGWPTALLAFFLCILSPDTLAHGAIVTNDLGIALFMFLTVVAFDLLTERVTWSRWLLAGLALGAAWAAKFSGMALIPILGGLALAVAFAPEPPLIALRERSPQAVAAVSRRLFTLTALLLAMCALALVVIWAAYGFHSRLSTDPAVNARFDWDAVQPEQRLLREPLQVAQRAHLLPEAWVFGFLHFWKHSQSRPAFLMGQYSERGWWYYFPLTFALKTPLPLLVLVAVAAVLSVRSPVGWRKESFLWLPVLIYGGLTMTRSINIGHRHLLPIYPFLFVAGGRCADLVWPAGRHRRSQVAAVGLALLAAWYAVSSFAIYPHYLAYFNELAGGPRNGYRYLVDSNLDWGQDLPGLKAFMERNHIPRIKLSYFGTADPAYYGISCDRLPGYQPPPPSILVREVKPGDVVAISATHLQGLYLDPEMQPLMERLRSLTPLAVIGYSIFIYRVDFAWSLP